MERRGERRRVVVAGAGVIGLACAWRAATAGWAVTLLDPAPGSGASWVAGGMLAPVTEAWPGEEALLDLGVEALARWPEFARELDAAAGRPCGLRTDGTIVVATGTGDRDELDGLAGHLARRGRTVERLTGQELRRREPSLGPDVRAGLSVPDDLSVDNRALLAALRAACAASGVRQVSSRLDAVLVDAADPHTDEGRARRVVAVRDTDDDTHPTDAVVIATGAHAGTLLNGLVRPVKGEILRLAQRPGALPPPVRTVRGLVDGRHVYLVPRDGGGLVVGATQSEQGFDTTVTVAGVRDLLRDAERVVPAVAEYALVESSAGLRPGTPDNLPLIGPVPGRPHGLVAAAGHGRNGMLLAPITADAVLDVLQDKPRPDVVRAADPARFTGG